MTASTGNITKEPRRLRALLISSGIAVLIVAGIAGATASLHIKASAKPEVAALPAIPVVTQQIVLQSQYEITETFTGRVEAAREATLAFERQGLIVAVLVDEGDAAVTGQVLAKLDTQILSAKRRGLVAERTQREADLKLARLTTKRQSALHRKGHASAQRFDEARLSVQSLEAAIANVESAIAAVDIDIEKSVLRAPFDGHIANRLRDEGEVAVPSTPVLSLLESGLARVRIGLPPRVAMGLEPGQSANVTVNGRVFSARLKALRRDLSLATRTVPAIFEIEITSRIPYGELASFFASRQLDARGAWVPVGALSEGPKGLWSISTVVSSDEGTRTGKEVVEVLHVESSQAFVRGSFVDGAQIVTTGLNRIAPGQVVTIRQVN
jgi:membrane fusion protein, multidrug efflux system